MRAVVVAREPSARYLDAVQPALVRQFGPLTMAPGGVARLRELILTLAVQGKLVPQDPSHEPASVLRHRIAAADNRLATKGRVRRAKPVSEVNEREQRFALPPGWEWARLGSLGDWGAGATPSRSNSRYYGGAIPWFKSGELTADFISESEEMITDSALADCSLRLNQVGDVLVAMYGATIGKTAILSVEGTTNQAVCACTPFAGLQNTYLLLLLKALKPHFVGIGAGGAQPNISREKIVATVVGLPPLEEQARIVARVDELMGLCDALEAKGRLEAEQHARLLSTLLGTLTDSTTPEELAANWQRVEEHFDLLLDRPGAVDAVEKIVLQLAVRGLLVPQAPDDEPASSLLAAIAKDRERLELERHLSGRASTSTDSDEVAAPYSVPSTWLWLNFGQYVHEVCTGPFGSLIHKGDYVPGGVPLLNPSHMVDGLVRHDPSVALSPKRARELTAYRLTAGDVLMARRGEVGRYAIVSEREEGWLCGTGSFFVRLAPDCNRLYFGLMLEDPRFRGGLLGESVGSTMINLNQKILLRARLAIPPLAEQARIVARVTELRRLCADLRQRLIEIQATQSRLADALIESALA